LHLNALVANIDGTEVVAAKDSAQVKDMADAIALGNRIADQLIADGAQQIIASLGN
jgi:hydroxymethylbilane synthase